MWALLSSRFRRWLVMAVGVPAALWAVTSLADELERRRGTTALSRGLRTGERLLRWRQRGPLARRPPSRGGGPLRGR